jgi:hypothetical protein
MNRKSTSPIPEPIVQLQRQLDQFRGTQQRRTKLPESLWQARLSRLEQGSLFRSSSIEQEMLSKAIERLSDADLDHIHNLAQRGGLSAEPTPEERSAVERLQVLCDGR